MRGGDRGLRDPRERVPVVVPLVGEVFARRENVPQEVAGVANALLHLAERVAVATQPELRPRPQVAHGHLALLVPRDPLGAVDDDRPDRALERLLEAGDGTLDEPLGPADHGDLDRIGPASLAQGIRAGDPGEGRVLRQRAADLSGGATDLHRDPPELRVDGAAGIGTVRALVRLDPARASHRHAPALATLHDPGGAEPIELSLNGMKAHPRFVGEPALVSRPRIVAE